MAKANSSGADEASPLIRQYYRIKSQHPEHILFFRCGDFYEMFNEDARIASQVLGIALTKRGTNGRGEPMPLAGIPYHSIEPYLARLIRAGYKVAMCEQMENPKTARGIVKREVVRVVTPGTVLEDNLLDHKSNNYIVGLIQGGDAYGLAVLDYSTGQFSLAEFSGPDAQTSCGNELLRIQPVEIILSREQSESLSAEFGWKVATQTRFLNGSEPPAKSEKRADGDGAGASASIATVDGPSWHAARESLLLQLGVRDLNGFGAEQMQLGVRAAGAVLEYLRETQKHQLGHITELRTYNPGQFMTLDATTQRSLELVSNLTDATRRNTLLEVLDTTCTAMGGRLLKQWIQQPLRSRPDIEARLDAIETFVNDHSLRAKACETLKKVHDLERIISRAACKTANPRDLLALRNSLQQVPSLRELLSSAVRSGTQKENLLGILCSEMNPLEELTAELERAIVENPPLTMREGGIIRAGYDEKLDEIRSVSGDSKSWIATMRQQEIERTGIQNLKIGFNKVFGYFIEISNSHLSKVPPEYIRKQTLVGAERFITQALKEKEEVILHAEERIQEIEFDLFEKLREKVCASTREVQQTARAVARLDALVALAQSGCSGNYCRPKITEDGRITIHDGRHPVLEMLDLDQPFVPNDTCLDNSENQILLITGPNMAGKSTYIRQTALITLMAHTGSFVPAREAHVCIVDRIFTRVGAMDQLAKGQSTFLVEMSETANILNNATDQSLVILDEIGRGTSTYDGLSIAWAVMEYLHNCKGRRPKTLFATHYHELVELEGPLERVKNYNVAVLEEEDKVAFLYKIVRGSTDRSYGIYAAQVAGLPRSAIERARQILSELESGNSVEVRPGKAAAKIQEQTVQLTLFDAAEHPVIQKLKSLDANKLTPIQALAMLEELSSQARK